MQYVGVRSTYEGFNLSRELLQFDVIVIPDLESHLKVFSLSHHDELIQQRVLSIEWLAERGIVQSPTHKHVEAALNSDDYLKAEAAHKDEMQKVVSSAGELLPDFKPLPEWDGFELIAHLFALSIQKAGDATLFSRLEVANRRSNDYLNRSLAIEIARERQDIIALPVLASRDNSEIAGLTRGDVLDIAIHQVPVPNESTPLEQLLDFRSDPDVRTDYLALHRWAATLNTTGKSANDITEEIEYLLAQYRRHMRIHRIEQGDSMLETVITIGAEALEDIVKLKWGDAAKLLFSIKKRSTALMKAELDAPGREVAFLDKAALLAFDGSLDS